MNKRLLCALFMSLLGVYLFTMGGHSYSVDEELYLSATKSFVGISTTLDLNDAGMAQRIAVISKEGDRGVHGAPVGVLLLYAPFEIAAKVIAEPFSGSTANEVYRLVFFSANSFYSAFAAAVVMSLAMGFGLSKRRSVALALIFGLCTYQWHYSATAFPQALSALTTLIAYFYWTKHDEASKSVKSVGFSGLAFGLSVAVRASNILFFPVFLIAIASKKDLSFQLRIRSVCMFLVSSSPGIILNAWFNWMKFGNPLSTGYGKLYFNTPIYEGIFGLFFSTGKGLIFYAPIALVAIFGLRESVKLAPRRNVFILSLVLIQASLYGKYEIWSGENSYGPRYLIPILPLVCLLVIPLARIGKQWLVGMWISGVVGFFFSGLTGKLMYFNAVYWNQQPGLLQDMDATSLTAKQQYLAWNFQPRSSPLILQLRAIPELISNTFSRLGGGLGKLDQIPISYDDRIHWYARTINLDFWWAWWPAKSSNQFVYLFLAVPIALIGFGGVQLMKELRVSESSNENENEI